MRTTLILDDHLMREAAELTGETEKTRLVHMGLRSLVEREASRRLAKLGGILPRFQPGRRRRTSGETR